MYLIFNCALNRKSAHAPNLQYQVLFKTMFLPKEATMEMPTFNIK